MVRVLAAAWRSIGRTSWSQANEPGAVAGAFSGRTYDPTQVLQCPVVLVTFQTPSTFSSVHVKPW